MVRVQERGHRQRRLGHAVVVDDHRVDPRPRRALQARVVARSAVARHEERRPCGEDARERGVREAVSAVEAIREERHHLRAEGAEHVGQERRRGHAIGVIVAEDADALPGAHGPGDAIDGLAPVPHRVRRRQVGEARIEEPRRFRGPTHPARHEHAGRRLREGE
jgi:hypothetical protein